MPISLDRATGLPTEGIHLCKITAAEEKKSQSGGDMWVVEYIVQTAGEDQGIKFNAFYALSDKARFKLNELLDAVKAPKKGTWACGDLVGKTVRAAIQHQEYQGRKTVGIYCLLAADSTDNPIIPPYKPQEATGSAATLPGSRGPLKF